MKKFYLFLSFLVVFLLLFPFGNNYTLAETTDDLNTHRVIIKFRPLLSRNFRENIVRNEGCLITKDLKLENTHVVKLTETKRDELINKLQRNLFVDYVEIDHLAYTTETPNDPKFSDQWGLTKIDAEGAWDVTHGSTNVDIAIVDTGINQNHPDLKDKIEKSVDCTAGSSCPNVIQSDPNGHGTHVAGIASAVTNNEVGIAGLSWDGRLMSVKVLDDDGTGYYSWVADGIVWAADNGAEVINLSLSGRYSSRTLKNAVNYAWNKGVVVVAAAGNDSSSRRRYPAYYSRAIAVAATDESDQKAYFSNYGSWVDVAAPGVSIISSYQDDYDSLSGTSMSAPHVAGLAGLLYGQNPTWTNNQVRNKLESTADSIPGTGSYWVHGRINACDAVGCDGEEPSSTPTPIPPTPTPTPTPEETPPPSTPTLTPTPIPPTPTPTSSPKPWWCRWLPNHRYCQ